MRDLQFQNLAVSGSANRQKNSHRKGLKSVRFGKKLKALRLQKAELPGQSLPTVPKAWPAPAEPLPESNAVGPVGSALSAYLRDVGQVALLTPEEEMELAAQIKKGNAAARERMIRANLRLVIKIARDYENLGLPLLDLISEGTIGLMKAIERFDPAKGSKLSTYSSWWIKQQIRRALSNQGRTIRLPVHVEARIYRLGLAERKLREVLGREATDKELAEELKMDERRLSRLRSAALHPAALDAPVGDEGGSTLSEVVGDQGALTPAECYERNADVELMRTMLKRLSQREVAVLRCRFGLNGEDERTLEEVGAEFGLTRERIRQVQNEALGKLRSLMEQQKTDL